MSVSALCSFHKGALRNTAVAPLENSLANTLSPHHGSLSCCLSSQDVQLHAGMRYTRWHACTQVVAYAHRIFFACTLFLTHSARFLSRMSPNPRTAWCKGSHGG